MKIEIEGTLPDILEFFASISKGTLSGNDIASLVCKDSTVSERTSQSNHESKIDSPPIQHRAIQIKKTFPKKTKNINTTTQDMGGGLKKSIDVFVGSPDKGFHFEWNFDSISEAARHIGVPNAANISPYVDSGKIYKGKYKFCSRKL